MRTMTEIMRYASESPKGETIPVSPREFRKIVEWFRASARFPGSVPDKVSTISLCGKAVEVIR